jgi:hypothetical protein
MFAIVALLHITAVFASEEPKLRDTAVLPELEGYQVRFDYENYPKEREIAWQYFLDNYREDRAFSEVKINDMGIDLYDIDNDGRKEIFVYINAGENCSRWGCPFAILKPLGSDKAQTKVLYKSVPLSETQNSTMQTHDKIRVLKSVSLNVHDLLFCDYEGSPSAIWKWQGDWYTRATDINFEFFRDAYSVQFDLKNYPEEREIAWQYFLDRFPGSQEEDFSFINKEDIAIDLYDIDSDGRKEILATLLPTKYITYYCHDDSCPFAILKPSSSDKHGYQEIAWDAYYHDNHYQVNATMDVKILPTVNSGFRDILFFNMNGIPSEIWKWDGNKYHSDKFFQQIKH